MSWLVLALVGVTLGLALGLFGGGGGILAVPLLLLAGVAPNEAASISLVVVALASLAGLIPNIRQRRIAWREGLIMGALGILAAIFGASVAINTNDAIKLWGFVALLLLAGTLMLRKALKPPTDTPVQPKGLIAVVLAGLGVGLVTGFFGVGGGFLIVPTLTLIMGMAMHRATATALVVIVINSMAALVPRLDQAMNWPVTITVAGAAIATSLVAARWSNRWSARNLGMGFAALVLVMAAVTALQAWSYS